MRGTKVLLVASGLLALGMGAVLGGQPGLVDQRGKLSARHHEAEAVAGHNRVSVAHTPL
jgi:hypothetical protein